MNHLEYLDSVNKRVADYRERIAYADGLDAGLRRGRWLGCTDPTNPYSFITIGEGAKWLEGFFYGMEERLHLTHHAE